MRRVVLVLLLGIPAFAEWPRHVLTAKGAWLDSPPAHALPYFVRDPLLRDDGNDFCIRCTPEEKASLYTKIKARADVQPVGRLNGFSIYDVLYYFGDRQTPDWKAVLVKVAPDRYREIFHVQRTQGDQSIGPSLLIGAGPEQLLSTVAFAGGNKGIVAGDYFWLSTAGAVIVDTSVLEKAAASVVPAKKRLYGQLSLDFRASTAKMLVISDGGFLCCDGGAVKMTFRLRAGRIVVTRTWYDPSDSPSDPGVAGKDVAGPP